MPRITTRLLGLIERLFQFPQGEGGSAPLQYDTATPLQPVHELGRTAELMAGYGNPAAPGYFLVGPLHAHAGSDDVFSSTDPRTVLAAANLPGVPASPLEIDVWWLDSWAYGDAAGIIGAANVVAYFPALPGSTTQRAKLLFNGSGRLAISNPAGAAGYDAATQSTHIMNTGPVLLPVGTLLNAKTTANAVAGNIVCTSRLWYGPRGARPPGLA